MCFTQMLQVHVSNVHLLSYVRCIQIFLMLQVFYVVQPGASGLDARRAEGPTDGGATVGGRWGVLVACVGRCEGGRDGLRGEMWAHNLLKG